MLYPKVSIITAVYNGGKYLEDLILSVAGQSYSEIEFIIIDGDSKDNSVQIVNKYRDKIHKFISEPDKGIYDAWNKGVEVSEGDWLCFIGSDDQLLSGAIQDYIEFISKNQQKDLEYVSSKVEMIDENGKRIGIWGEPWDWKVFKWNMKVAHVGSLHHRSLFQRVGKFDDQYKIAGDYELLLRAGEGLSAGFLNKVTAKMMNSGVSNNDFRAYKEAIRAKCTTGNRSFILAVFDFLYIYLAVNLKRVIHILRP